jgi:uncharacterized protein (TIGR01319 family)
MTGAQAGSILAVDCGSTTTKAILLEVAEGQYRLVSRCQVPSTARAPWHDVTVGAYHAVRRTSAITGRRMLDQNDQIILPERGGGEGVDLLVTTVSAAPPLRVVVAGLSKEISLESARRAVQTTYCRLVEQIAVDETPRRTDGQWLQAVQSAQAEAILLVGGVDGGETGSVVEMARLMALAVQLQAERPPMIYAGNAALRGRIAELLGDHVELRAVDNVRPALDQENLAAIQAELERVFRQNVMSQLPGVSLLKRWSRGEVMSTARGFERVIRYLDRIDAKPRYGVLGIDVGGMTTTVAAARDGRFGFSVLTDLGVGASVGDLFARIPVEGVTRWLPLNIPPQRVHHVIMNKALRPWTVPQTQEELLVEQAVAREVIGLALDRARSGWPFKARRGAPIVNEIVGSGSTLTFAPTPGHAMLMLLDTVQPAFWTSRVALDQTGALPALGALATVQPQAAAQILEQDGLFALGSVIAPVGVAGFGAKVLTFKVTTQQGTYEGDVRFGTLERIVVPTGTKAKLELRPTRRFDLGMGPGRGVRMETWGGAVGVIIDARGRPLAWPARQELRQKMVRRWMLELGAWSSPAADPSEQLGDF